ncbi:hypothetical protein BKA69DRAFT_1095545 [Paraphysoderma sedebokerense]|nr:hypothetical protein BKA69DRAFT_1095879 [Paraphysoderma sedebokerense]KAI9137857.1 hypothetical protein BKA69DRAFT_1095545 [Paraphysoderma sedebokerense]
MSNSEQPGLSFNDLNHLYSWYLNYSETAPRRSEPVLQTVQQNCEQLFSRDYEIAVIPNDLTTSYPLNLIITESQKNHDINTSESKEQTEINAAYSTNKLSSVQAQNETSKVAEKSHLNTRPSHGAAKKVNDAKALAPLFKKSRFARVRGRFVVPVILVNGKNICRSSTLSSEAEVLFNTFNEKTKQFWYGPASDNSDNGSDEDDTGQTIMEKQRMSDIQLLKKLKVKIINDLMVENRKVKYGLTVTSSEKADSQNRYQNAGFSIACVPYPGVEFFRDFKLNKYCGRRLFFDWNQAFANAELSIPMDIKRGYLSELEKTAGFKEVKWTEYKNWDLVQLTQNYMKLFLQFIAEPSKTSGEDMEGLLIHCISGWDRTPLLLSLLRLSLWADGLVHQSLSAEEILYLTIGYDWVLFSHLLSDRMSRGEDIFSFCFYFLRFILGDEFSIRPDKNYATLSGGHSRRRKSVGPSSILLKRPPSVGNFSSASTHEHTYPPESTNSPHSPSLHESFTSSSSSSYHPTPIQSSSWQFISLLQGTHSHNENHPSPQGISMSKSSPHSPLISTPTITSTVSYENLKAVAENQEESEATDQVANEEPKGLQIPEISNLNGDKLNYQRYHHRRHSSHEEYYDDVYDSKSDRAGFGTRKAKSDDEEDSKSVKEQKRRKKSGYGIKSKGLKTFSRCECCSMLDVDVATLGIVDVCKTVNDSKPGCHQNDYSRNPNTIVPLHNDPVAVPESPISLNQTPPDMADSFLAASMLSNCVLLDSPNDIPPSIPPSIAFDVSSEHRSNTSTPTSFHQITEESQPPLETRAHKRFEPESQEVESMFDNPVQAKDISTLSANVPISASESTSLSHHDNFLHPSSTPSSTVNGHDQPETCPQPKSRNSSKLSTRAKKLLRVQFLFTKMFKINHSTDLSASLSSLPGAEMFAAEVDDDNDNDDSFPIGHVSPVPGTFTYADGWNNNVTGTSNNSSQVALHFHNNRSTAGFATSTSPSLHAVTNGPVPISQSKSCATSPHVHQALHFSSSVPSTSSHSLPHHFDNHPPMHFHSAATSTIYQTTDSSITVGSKFVETEANEFKRAEVHTARLVHSDDKTVENVKAGNISYTEQVLNRRNVDIETSVLRVTSGENNTNSNQSQNQSGKNDWGNGIWDWMPTIFA